MVKNDDLISRLELVEILSERGYPRGYVKEIEDAPLSDITRVIRCKNCAYYGTNKELNVEIKGSCLFWAGCALGVKPDDFCSHAVRKTDWSTRGKP